MVLSCDILFCFSAKISFWLPTGCPSGEKLPFLLPLGGRVMLPIHYPSVSTGSEAFSIAARRSSGTHQKSFDAVEKRWIYRKIGQDSALLPPVMSILQQVRGKQ